MSTDRRKFGSCPLIFGFLAAFLLTILYVKSRTRVQSSVSSQELSEVYDVYESATENITVFDEDEKIILFWTPFFESRDFYFGLGRSAFERAGCVEKRCRTTTDKRLLSKSHAVVFHVRNVQLERLPKFRKPSQRWVFFLLESPENTPNDILYSLDGFNWTMTYRQDSDIYLPYGRFRSKQSSNEDIDHVLKRKSKKVAWFVSHCQTASKREDYADELSKHIPVDIYGSCGPLTCKEHKPCNEMLRDTYKFYLAFENSLCRDYVTEKFFKAFEYYVVPVVYGGANYSAIAPPHSYIDTRDFSSPKHLAEYLNYLSQNESAYREYFEWRSLYEISYSSQSWCDLCSSLHNSSAPPKTYQNMHHWWVDESHCMEQN